MKKMLNRAVVVLGCFLLLTSFAVNGNIERIYTKMESKQLQDGKTITLKSEICFEQNGDMVMHYTYPVEYIVITNKVGEIKIYDPAKNTVISKQSDMFSTQSSQLVYFLTGKSSDMGLNGLGFKPVKTYLDKSSVVTEWMHKVPDTKAKVNVVKLVHQQQKPIYMDYKDVNNAIIRKVFYSNYKQMGSFNFPATTTEFIYNASKDSVVSRTSYSDFKVNAEATSPYFGYKVPANAKKAE